MKEMITETVGSYFTAELKHRKSEQTSVLGFVLTTAVKVFHLIFVCAGEVIHTFYQFLKTFPPSSNIIFQIVKSSFSLFLQCQFCLVSLGNCVQNRIC